MFNGLKNRTVRSTPTAFCVIFLLCGAGCVDSRCFTASDCEKPKICNAAGLCTFECIRDDDCAADFICVDYRCAPKPPSESFECPDDMVEVSGAFCIDRYEASRPDADPYNYGIDESRATSAFGVLPWRVESNAVASEACRGAGKRLCSASEWKIACEGPNHTVYGYGDTYRPNICNGIDSFGEGNFHLIPTGSFPDCTNEWGAFDLNGNLWEHTADGSDATVRGGAYNCLDSATLHRCDYVPGDWTPSARGFRCCLSPEETIPIPTDTDTGTQPPDTDDGQCVVDTNDQTKDSASAGESGYDTDTNTQTESVGDTGTNGETDTAEDTLTALDSDLDSDSGASIGTDSAINIDTLSDGPIDTQSDTARDTQTDSTADTALDTASETVSDTGTDLNTFCPEDMVHVGGFCMDRFEASRKDATDVFQGRDNSVALSRAGVLPWYVNPMTDTAFSEFRAACERSGKRLCSAVEWTAACEGSHENRYAFGNDWDPSICNSVDTFCETCCDILGLSDCPSGENCGYSSTISASPYTPETCFVTEDYNLDTCPVCFHVMPTGAFPQCTSETGAFDVNGNVWEAAATSTTDDPRGYRLQGGAFNCGSPSFRFQCTFNATWSSLYAGFRCCRDEAPR